MTVAADLTYLPWVGPAAGTDAPCVRDERRELSYRDIERAAAAVAEQFAEHGVGRGDVVAVRLPNSVELLVAVLAAWRLGAAATPVNPTFTAREVGYQVADARAAVLVGDLAAIRRYAAEVLGDAAAPGEREEALRTAEDLGVHRNTVRQRVTRFEAGRAGPIDRVELTLALRLYAAFG